MLAWGLALSIYKCNLLGEKLYVPFFLCLLWPTLCACVCAKNDFTVCEPYVFSFFFLLFTWSCGEESHSCAVFFFFWGALLYFLSFFPFSFLYEEKKGSENSNKKNNQHFWCWGERKTPHPDKMLLFFFLALNKTKTMNPPFFFNVTMAASFVVMTFWAFLFFKLRPPCGYVCIKTFFISFSLSLSLSLAQHKRRLSFFQCTWKWLDLDLVQRDSLFFFPPFFF